MVEPTGWVGAEPDAQDQGGGEGGRGDQPRSACQAIDVEPEGGEETDDACDPNNCEDDDRPPTCGVVLTTGHCNSLS